MRADIASLGLKFLIPQKEKKQYDVINENRIIRDEIIYFMNATNNRKRSSSYAFKANAAEEEYQELLFNKLHLIQLRIVRHLNIIETSRIVGYIELYRACILNIV